MPKVSVIIPVYNVEKYLPQCLDSVLSQTLSDLEIILVDDGSTDTSGQICDQYAAKDARIQIVHQQNIGLSGARQTGFQRATGQYVASIDSDDFLDLSYFENLYQQAIQFDLDIVSAQIYQYKDESNITNATNLRKNCIVSKLSQKLSYIRNAKPYFWTSIVNKLYRHGLIKRLETLPNPSHLCCGEDCLWMLKAAFFAKRMGGCSKAIYYYRYNPTSITSQKNDKMVHDKHLVMCEMIEFMNNYHFPKHCMDIVLLNNLYHGLCTKETLPTYLQKTLYAEIYQQKISPAIPQKMFWKICSQLTTGTWHEYMRQKYIFLRDKKFLYSRRPRILFTLDQVIMGGVEKASIILLPALAEIYDVAVLVAKPVQEPFFQNFFRENHITVHCPFSEKPRAFLKRKYRKFLGRRLEKYRCHRLFKSFDLILDYKNLYWSEELKKITIPKITVFHGSFPLFQEWQTILKLPVYNRLICLSDNFKQNFIQSYPSFKDKIDRIYNPLDITTIQQQAKSETVTIPHPYFVAVQRLDLDKDVPTVIKAFNLFCKNNTDFFLYIIGDGPQRSPFEKLAEGNNRIIFTGQMNNPYPLIKSAQALILSSQASVGEGFALTLLEAQALGTLAISSDVPSGPPEILMNGQAGLLFPTGNAEALAQILQDVATHHIDTATLIDCATKNLDRFDKTKITTQFLQLIQQSIKGDI